MKTRRFKVRFALLCVLSVVLLAAMVAACTEPSPSPSPSPAPAPSPSPAPAPSPSPAPAPSPSPSPTPAPSPSPSPSPAPSEEVIKLIAHTTTPPVAAPGQCLDLWANQLEEMSGGRVEVVRYYSSALFEQKEAIRSLLVGTADIHFDYMVGEDPGLMKLNLYIDLPFLGYTSKEQGIKVFRALLENIPEMKAEFQGLKVLYPMVYSTTSYMHSTKRLIQTTEDLKGLKFMAHGYSAKWYEAMGATTVKLSWPEFYTSYEKGVIDSMTSNMGPHIASGMIELSKYHTRILPKCFSIGSIVNLMNPDSFNSLPPDIQKIIEDLDDDIVQKRWELEDADDLNGEAMAEEMGQTIVTLSPEVNQEWVDAAAPIHEEWIEDMESNGVPARHFFEELRRLQAEYQ